MNLLRFSLLFFAFSVLLSGAFATNWDVTPYFEEDPYALAVYHCDETSGTNVSDATGNFDATATNALIWDANGKWGGACGMDGTYYVSQDTLMDVNTAKWTVEFWMKPLETFFPGIGSSWYLITKETRLTNNLVIFMTTGTGAMQVYLETFNDTTIINSPQTTWNQDQWYHIGVEHDGTNLALYVDGVKQVSDVAEEMTAGTVSDFFIGSTKTGTNKANVVFDEIAISSIDRNATSWVYGVAPDLDIVKIEGYNFDGSLPAFSYLADGNLTIDFNVFQYSNDRLTVDLNYSATNTQGTGTPFATDLNLTSQICTSQDWNVIPQKCSVDLNISGLTDANYYIIGNLKSIDMASVEREDFNASSKSFMVANDVNLNIKIPIDEVTNAVIDTTVTSFIVKILQGGTLSTYSGQVDQNYFMFPFGTGETIVVQIDTNRTDLYNGRTYSYLFEVTQPKLVLQPYLAPVANSVLTTIHTLSAANLNPLSDLRVKVFKDLVGGRTLVHDSLTDGKGETAIPFVIADEYEIEVYDGSTLLTTKDYTATSTTNNLYFYISEEGEIVIPEFANVSVNFLPAIRTHSTRDVNVSVVIASNTLSVSAIQVIAVNNDVNIYDSGMDVSAPSDGNTYIVEFSKIDTMDGNYPVEFVVIVRLENGDEFYFNDDSFWFGRGSNNLITLLTFGMRTDFGCDPVNFGVTCEPLLFIALFIILFAVAGIGLTTFRNGIGLTILLLILAGAFTYIAWVPLWIYVIMFMAGIGAILSMSRMD